MSGPKTSTYVSRWAQNNIAEQLRCIREGRKCVGEINELLASLFGCREEIENAIRREDILLSRGSGSTDRLKELQQLSDSIGDKVEEIKSKVRTNEIPVETPLASDEALQEKRNRLGKLKKQKKAIDAEIQIINSTVGDIAQAASQDLKEVKTIIEQDLNKIDVSFDFSEEGPDAEQVFEDRKKDMFMKMTQMTSDSRCDSAFLKEVANAMQRLERIVEINQLKTFGSLTMKSLQKKYEDLVNKETEQKNEIILLQKQYADLCTIAKVNAKAITDIDELHKEISAIEQILIKQSEQEYIARSVDEVMQEMGYDLLGSRSVTKKSGKRFHNELFQFDEGTAVNVTFSSDGQIAMELGGISREDRLPTAEECSYLEQEMVLFCDRFAEIEKRLAEKGIAILNRIAMSPPAEEYAAIININDYNMEKDVNDLAVDIKKKKGSKSGKVLRRNE